MNIAQYIDHTLLKQDATEEQIKTLCDEARENKFKSVCVNPSWVSYCKDQLRGSEVLVCTVIGFPLGATSSASKSFETKAAIADGADEIDMVLNIGKLLSSKFEYVENDIAEVVKAASGKTVKVILETCLLSVDEIKKACELCLKANAHFVKTSTGFSTGGATIEAVQAMKEVVEGKSEIKASGGIRDFEKAKEYLDLGVTRLGTSSGVAIVKGQVGEDSY